MRTLSTRTTVQQLEPLPIDFDPVGHRYTWLPTGERLTNSVTRILRASKSQRTLDIFAKTKHIWAPRGTYVHEQLEFHLRGLRGPVDGWVDGYEGEYGEYVKPVLGWDHLLDVMVLLDLKTLGRGSRQYSTDAQLGGYLSMLIDHHKLVVDECLTLWAGHGECHLGASQSPAQCLEAWENAYDLWAMQREAL